MQSLIQSICLVAVSAIDLYGNTSQELDLAAADKIILETLQNLKSPKDAENVDAFNFSPNIESPLLSSGSNSCCTFSKLPYLNIL